MKGFLGNALCAFSYIYIYMYTYFALYKSDMDYCSSNSMRKRNIKHNLPEYDTLTEKQNLQIAKALQLYICWEMYGL